MKRSLVLSMVGLILILLTSCGSEKENRTTLLEPLPAEQEEIPDADGGPKSEEDTGVPEGGAVQPSEAGGSPENAYSSVYAQTIRENTGDAFVYALIYLDADQIPELVACDRGRDSYSIYTVKDGDIVTLADSLTTVEMTYFERRGIIAEFARWNGGGDEGGYGQYFYQVSKETALTEDSVPVLNYTYNAVYDEEGSYTGEGVISYFYMGQETDEKTYQEKMGSLGISEGADRPCLEEVLEEAEILSLFNS